MTIEDKKRQVVQRGAQVIKDAQTVVEKALRPTLTQKNFEKIGGVFSSLANNDFLQNAFFLDRNKAAVAGLIEAMQKYLAER